LLSFSTYFLFLPTNFFAGFFLFMACSCTSSRQIQSGTPLASLLCVTPSWASILTGTCGSIYFVCTATCPRKKFMTLAVPLCLFDQNLSIWSLRWLNRFRTGGRSGSTSRNTNPLKPKNMD
jgi:hypothetical protein